MTQETYALACGRRGLSLQGNSQKRSGVGEVVFVQERKERALGESVLPSTLVVKLGGSALAEIPDAWFHAFAYLVREGVRLVLVHGGGKAIDTWLEAIGEVPETRNGLRITDEATIPLVEMVLSGLVNKELVRRLARFGIRAVGMSGTDGEILKVQRHSDQTLGRVGHVVRVSLAPLEALWAAGFVPVLSPVSAGEDGEAYNVNADEAAGAIAEALGAPVVLATDVPGILAGGRLLSQLSPKDVRALGSSGVFKGGMLPKVEAALRALAGGAPWAVILSGRDPEALAALFTGEKVGTRIIPEAFCSETSYPKAGGSR